MIEATRIKVAAGKITNVQLCLRDFVAEGTDLHDESVDYVMLFNILHMEHPTVLLEEAYRVLVPDGKIGITHWNYDSSTPRGPSMQIRPRQEQCISWASQVSFHLLPLGIIDLPPHHYGIVLQKSAYRRSPHE